MSERYVVLLLAAFFFAGVVVFAGIALYLKGNRDRPTKTSAHCSRCCPYNPAPEVTP